MKNYNGLSFKTLGNANPQGNPRVYFCCAKDDFDKFFEPVTQEILDIQTNAAIWYYNPADGIPNNDRFYADLSQMQLFVIPVTSNFLLTKNHARNSEFKYAVKHGIPVLPILLESNLESDFSRICGDIQLLDKTKDDPTALPYAEKLKTFLESILISNELSEKIRDAFDAYIFLSYRKKDRKYAQEIMRLIHENEFCRDIAIWYDEFLTPGDNFNDAIQSALEKSSLFALAVTPNLLEQPNYVMTTEYPNAKKANKPILPIEAIRTNSQKLKKLYPDIDEKVQVTNKSLLAKRLKNALSDAVNVKNDTDSSHIFFIGLAYLSGIDVEKDPPKALELITRAAKMNLPEAYQKLFIMYKTGEGVTRDYTTAIAWQKKYVSMLNAKYTENPCKDTLDTLFKELNNLFLILRNVLDYAGAKKTAKKMLSAAESMKAYDETESDCLLVDAYEQLGKITKDEGHLKEALGYFQKNLEISAVLSAKLDTFDAVRDYTFSLSNLSDVYRINGKISEALKYSKACLNERIRLDERWHSETTQELLLYSYNEIGKICAYIPEYENPLQYFEKSLEISTRMYEQTKKTQYRNYMATAYNNIAGILDEIGEDKNCQAQKYLEQSLSIAKELSDELDTPNARISYAKALKRLGQFYITHNSMEKATELLLQSHKIYDDLSKNINSVTIAYELGLINKFLGDIKRSEEKYDEAWDYYETFVKSMSSLTKKTDLPDIKENLASAYENLGSICIHKCAYDEAKTYFMKGIRILRILAKQSETDEAKYNLALSYVCLGDACKEAEDFPASIKNYLECLAVIEGPAKIQKYKKYYNILKFVYSRLYEIYSKEGNTDKAAEYREKELKLG